MQGCNKRVLFAAGGCFVHVVPPCIVPPLFCSFFLLHKQCGVCVQCDLVLRIAFVIGVCIPLVTLGIMLRIWWCCMVVYGGVKNGVFMCMCVCISCVHFFLGACLCCCCPQVHLTHGVPASSTTIHAHDDISIMVCICAPWIRQKHDPLKNKRVVCVFLFAVNTT